MCVYTSKREKAPRSLSCATTTTCLDSFFYISTTAELPLTHICGLLSCLIIFIPKGVKIKKLKAHFVILREIPSNIAQQQLQAPANEMPSHDSRKRIGE